MKRQLPSWMLGVSSSNQVNATDSSRNSCDKDIENARVEREPKGLKKRKQSTHATDSSRNSCDNDIEDGRVEREPKGLKKCKQSSRNNCGNDIDCERVEGERKRFKNKGDQRAKFEEKTIECENKETVEHIDSVKGKRLVKCRETKRTTRENASSYAETSKNKTNSGKATEHIVIKNGEDAASTDCLDNEDNEDLTLEDLMVIANEYIQEDDKSNQVELSKEDMSMSVNQSRGIAEATEGNSFKQNLSVNPTQSILDLFLGPVLKQTQEEEEKKVVSKFDDWDLEYKAYKLKSVPVEEKPVTTTLGKKKCSLKEKVMMFLD